MYDFFLSFIIFYLVIVSSINVQGGSNPNSQWWGQGSPLAVQQTTGHTHIHTCGQS